jgi:hypothetical protein
MWHVSPMADALEIPLKGPEGEPVDFLRTIASHGVAELPPNELSLEERTLVTTLPVGGSARTVRLRIGRRKNAARVDCLRRRGEDEVNVHTNVMAESTWRSILVTPPLNFEASLGLPRAGRLANPELTE